MVNQGSSVEQPAVSVQSPDIPAAILSYLVPGLGQLYQGRIGKGLLFLVCLYGLFFTGMYMGHGVNVYLPDSVGGQENANKNNPWGLPRTLANVYNRLQFAGQFWIGVAAWPAIWQYNSLPVPFSAETHPFLHNFQKEPLESKLNEIQSSEDKSWDLAWVYTVIAGVLNILVIYDAFAGPTFSGENRTAATPPTKETAAA